MDDLGGNTHYFRKHPYAYLQEIAKLLGQPAPFFTIIHMFFCLFSRVETYGISMYPLVSQWMLFKVVFNWQDSKRSLKKPSDCNLKIKRLNRFPPFCCLRLPKCLASFQGFKPNKSLQLVLHGAVSAFRCFFSERGKSPTFFTPCDGCETLMAWCCWRWRWFFLHLTSCCCNTEIQGGEGEVQRGTESSWSLQTEEVF